MYGIKAQFLLLGVALQKTHNCDYFNTEEGGRDGRCKNNIDGKEIGLKGRDCNTLFFEKNMT